MKTFPLIATLTLSAMLSACGGGGGGGAYGPTQTSPGDIQRPGSGFNPETSDTTNTDLTMMKTMVVDNSNDGFSKLIQETLVSAYQNHGISVATNHSASTTRAASIRAAATYNNDSNDYMKNICKSERDCNQEVFENMKKILIDQNLENASAQELRNALILAGFENDLHGMWDDIKDLQKYIREHQAEIKENTDNIYNDYIVTLENAKLRLANVNDKEENYIKLLLDDSTNKITGIAFNNEMILPRQGTDNKFVAEPEHLYIYGLRIGTDCTKGACAPGQGHEITFESEEEITDIDELKKQLWALFKEAYDDGDLNSLHGGTNNGQWQNGDNEKLLEWAKEFINGLTAEDFKNTNMDNITYDHVFYNEVDSTFETDYQSYAKELGLSYSDFGKLNTRSTEKYSSRDKTESSDEIQVFAGGYKAKKIDKTDMTGKMTFTGRAVGGVNFRESDNWTGANPKTDTLTLDSKKVTLDFDNGNEKLTANFDNWYDVTIETKTVGSNKLTFNNGNKIAKDNFKFRGQNSYVVENFTGNYMIDAYGTEHVVAEQGHSGVTGNSQGAMDIGYYGDSGIPTEATGYIAYKENTPLKPENNDGQERIKDIEVTIGFGVKQP